MLKGAELIGLPIFTSDSGLAHHKTQDIIISQEKDRLSGFLVNKGGWSGQARVIPWSEVIMAGPSALLVRSDHSIVDARDVPEIEWALEHEHRLRGMRMCTTGGLDLGIIKDVFFDPQTGHTAGYEVCGQFLDDADLHCTFISARFKPSIKDQAAWVLPEAAATVQRQIKNIQRIQLPAKGSALALPDAAMAQAANLSGAADRARGRDALWDIRAADGSLIAVRGQPITEDVVQRAIEHHRLLELLRAAGLRWADDRPAD